MKSPGPSKAERLAQVVPCPVGIIVAIVFAVWSRSLFSIIFAASATLLLSVSLLRSRKVSEEEMLGRQDRAMAKTKDDPKEMARWVPDFRTAP
jgi:hypothetical protein